LTDSKNYTRAAQEDKRKRQSQLDQEVRQFLANGGKIQKMPVGLCAGHSRISRDSRQVRIKQPHDGDKDG
jgi:hypothetical protein